MVDTPKAAMAVTIKVEAAKEDSSRTVLTTCRSTRLLFADTSINTGPAPSETTVTSLTARKRSETCLT